MGADFVVEFLPYGLTEPLQVKTSDNGETLAVILPLPDPLPGRFKGRLSDRMKKHIVDHSRKHRNVRWILFVARTGHRKDESQVKDEIWRETRFIFKIFKHRANLARKKRR